MPKVNLGLQIGDWVKAKTDRSDYTQKQVAEMLGVTQQALSQRIRHNSFSYETMRSLFKIFGCSNEEIAGVMKGRYELQ